MRRSLEQFIAKSYDNQGGNTLRSSVATIEEVALYSHLQEQKDVLWSCFHGVLPLQCRQRPECHQQVVRFLKYEVDNWQIWYTIIPPLVFKGITFEQTDFWQTPESVFRGLSFEYIDRKNGVSPLFFGQDWHNHHRISINSFTCNLKSLKIIN